MQSITGYILLTVNIHQAAAMVGKGNTFGFFNNISCLIKSECQRNKIFVCLFFSLFAVRMCTGLARSLGASGRKSALRLAVHLIYHSIYENIYEKH